MGMMVLNLNKAISSLNNKNSVWSLFLCGHKTHRKKNSLSFEYFHGNLMFFDSVSELYHHTIQTFKQMTIYGGVFLFFLGGGKATL